MRPELQEIVLDFHRASARLERLKAETPEDAWFRRPPGGGWSAAECVIHLNRTGERFLPLLGDALVDVPRIEPEREGRRMRRDPVGWLLWRTMAPPVRVARVKAPRRLHPEEEGEVVVLADVLLDFERLQLEQIRLVESAEGLAIDRVFVPSPIDRRAKYSIYSALSILPRHQHRHLWQAGRAVERTEER